MAAPRRGLFDVADLLDDEPLPRRAVINPLNGKNFSTKYNQMLERRRRLPIWPIKEEFLRVLARRKVVVLHGEAAGSGKTTQIPQFLLEARGLFGRPRIACAQPWRVSAMSVANRVAEELDVTIGEEVGYSIPFESCTSNRTVIKLMTHDILVREALSDHLLSEYNVIVVDEAQERTQSTDLLLIILKDILPKRIDLKLVVMSRSDEADGFVKHFEQCGVPRLMAVPEIVAYPVEILYSPEEPNDYVGDAVAKAVEVHLTQPTGDLLLFLPRDMIQEACTEIEHALRLRFEKGLCEPFLVMPLYSDLPLEMQDQVFQPAPKLWRVGIAAVRRIIVSTHIAECSLIIDNITYVIDSGISEQKHYDPIANSETVILTRVNKVRALERSACAGRTRPGRCFRLYTQARFMMLTPRALPEIIRSDISCMVLKLLKFGIKNLVATDYLNPPPPHALMRALDVLYNLGAVDIEGRLTLFGEAMGEIPLHPQSATMLLCSPEFYCANEILTISAMLSVPSCFLQPRAAQEAAIMAHARLRHTDGGHFTLLNVYNVYKKYNHNPRWCEENFINMGVMRRAESVREKLLAMMTRLNYRIQSPNISNPSFTNNIKMALLSGFFMQTAHLDQDGKYRTIKYNQVVRIDPELDNEAQRDWVMFNEYAMRDELDIGTVTPITPEMLIEVARHFCDLGDLPESGAKHALRTLLIARLIRMDAKLGFLTNRPFHVVSEALQTLQWLAPVRTEVAPPAS